MYRYLDDSEQDNDSIRQGIEESDEYYFGRKPAPVADGRSDSVSMDVQSMVTATLASIMDSFANETPAAFKPLGDGDEVAAETETFAVAQQIDEAGGYLELHKAVESALRYYNGAVRVFVDTVATTEKRILPRCRS